MGWIQALCVGAVVLISIGVRQWLLYPGRWNEMFGAEYEKPRRALARRRREVRDAERNSRRRREAARVKYAEAISTYRARIDRAEKRVRSLRNPGPGDRVTGLGRIAMHERVLRVFEEDIPPDGENSGTESADAPSTDIPLAGLTIECTASGSRPEMHVRLKHESVRSLMVNYAKATYPERFVRGFVSDVEKAIPRAQAAQAQAEREIEEAEAAVVEAREDTEAVDAARAERERVGAEEAASTAIPRARDALDAERDVWKTISGRRPLL